MTLREDFNPRQARDASGRWVHIAGARFLAGDAPEARAILARRGTSRGTSTADESRLDDLMSRGQTSAVPVDDRHRAAAKRAEVSPEVARDVMTLPGGGSHPPDVQSKVRRAMAADSPARRKRASGTPDFGGPAGQTPEERAYRAALKRNEKPDLLMKLKKAAALSRALREEVGKPGTNWKQVGPEARHKLSPLIKHYMAKAHPFTACVNDNTKRFGPDRAKRICAVVKDLGMRSTKWRKGPQKVTASEVSRGVSRLILAGLRTVEDVRLIEAYLLESVPPGEKLVEPTFGERLKIAHVAEQRLDMIDRAIGVSRLVEGAGKDPDGDALLREAIELLVEIEVADIPRHRDGKWTNLLRRVTDSGGETQGIEDAYAGVTAAGHAGGGDVPPPVAEAVLGGVPGFTESKHKRAARGSKGGGRFVRSGSSGDIVRGVQRKVATKTDGLYGSKTVAAVRAFQQKHGLTVDGVVGHQTAAAITGRKNPSKVRVGRLTATDRHRLTERGKARRVREDFDPSQPRDPGSGRWIPATGRLRAKLRRGHVVQLHGSSKEHVVVERRWDSKKGADRFWVAPAPESIQSRNLARERGTSAHPPGTREVKPEKIRAVKGRALREGEKLEEGIFPLSREELSKLAGRRRRDPHGRFADEMKKLGKGGSFQVGNIKVAHTSNAKGAKVEAYNVSLTRTGERATERAVGKGDALRKALDASARDNHPESLGGKKVYNGYKDFARESGIPGHAPHSHDDLEEKGAELLGDGAWNRGVEARVSALEQVGDSTKKGGSTQSLFKKGGTAGPGGAIEGGFYSAERLELHHAIARTFLQGISSQENPEALFMAGGPASGKSTMLRSGVVGKPNGSVLINPDAVKGMIPEYAELLRRKNPAASGIIHEESADIAKLIVRLAAERRMNLTVDKTKIKPKETQAFERMGYSVRGAVATTKISDSLARAKKRGDRTGRHVPDEILIPGHAEVAKKFESWAAESKMDIVLMDTGHNKVIAVAESGSVRTVDMALYTVFKQRAETVD